MRFNFKTPMGFATPKLEPIVSVYAVEYLKSQQSNFSPEQQVAFDLLCSNLPSLVKKMRTETARHDMPEQDLRVDWERMAHVECDEDDTADYLEYECFENSDKDMYCVVAPDLFQYTKSLTYPQLDIDDTQDLSLGWSVLAVASHLDALCALCADNDVSFNWQALKNIIHLKTHASNVGEKYVHEFSAQDFAQGLGFVLYDTTKQAYMTHSRFSGHSATGLGSLSSATLFETEQLAQKFIKSYTKKDASLVVVPARIHLSGVVATDDPVLQDALAHAQHLRITNELLQEEVDQLRAQLGIAAPNKTKVRL